MQHKIMIVDDEADVIDLLVMNLRAGGFQVIAVEDGATVRRAWLYPLRDLMGFGFWVRSFFGRRVRYRGEPYELLPQGRLRKLAE